MQRETLLKDWLTSVYPNQPFELSFAAADADFRRYFRATFADGSTVICMDAPPEKMRESVANYLKVRDLFSSLNVPTVLAKNLELGFIVLNDLGDVQYLKAMQQENTPEAHKALLLEAIDELIVLQQASQPNQLPEYSREILLREMNLFPEWFVAKELNGSLNFAQRQLWQQTLDALLPVIEAQPKVYVHRDFIVRNLMLTRGRPAVLDFQAAKTTYRPAHSAANTPSEKPLTAKLILPLPRRASISRQCAHSATSGLRTDSSKSPCAGAV